MLSLLSIVVSLALVTVWPQSQPPSPPAAASHRLRLIRATDKTPIANAEVFDIDGGEDGRRAAIGMRLVEHPEEEFSKRAQRLVADGDGFVALGPARWHALLARSPGWFQLRAFFDFERMRGDALELLPDDPLTIELKDARGAGVEGLVVELGEMGACGSGPNYNSTWRAASDRSGRVFLPHYAWWVSDDLFGGSRFLTPQFPLAKAPELKLSRIPWEPSYALPVLATSVTWELPPLSKVRVEFVGAETLPVERPITFELVGPNGLFGIPDRYASDRGAPVEVPSEAGVPLRAQFHWSEPDADRIVAPDCRAFGAADAREGGTAVLRVVLTSDPVVLRVRPVRGDGSTFSGPSAHPRFDAVVGWRDRRGFRWSSRVDSLAADETGALRFPWRRPRLADDERPATLHVALRRAVHLWGWEPVEVGEDVARDVPWPAGPELDVGTLIVDASR